MSNTISSTGRRDARGPPLLAFAPRFSVCVPALSNSSFGRSQGTTCTSRCVAGARVTPSHYTASRFSSRRTLIGEPRPSRHARHWPASDIDRRAETARRARRCPASAHDCSLLDKPEAARTSTHQPRANRNRQLIWKPLYDESDKIRQRGTAQDEIPCPKSDRGLSFIAVPALESGQDPATGSGSGRNLMSEIGHMI